MKRIILLFSLVLFIFCSCTQKEQPDTPYLSIRGFTQGTTYLIKYSSPDTVNYKNEIQQILLDIDTSMSTYNQASVISKVNRNDTEVDLDPYFKEVFQKAIEVSRKTQGAFDITVAPLVNAWGFDQEEIPEVDQKHIDSIMAFVGYDKVELRDGKIYKEDQRVQINMNAIAQGYTVDVLAEFLDDQGVQDYLVEVGGEVRTKGISPSQRKWRLGIDKPVDSNNISGRNLQAIVELQNQSLATSGNYRNFYIKDGVKYAHTIDPKTGQPVQHKLLSVSVFADECVMADAYATAFMVLGMEKSKKLLEEIEGMGAYFIYSDEEGAFKVEYTDNIENLVIQQE